jgi:hypothetical protein
MAAGTFARIPDTEQIWGKVRIVMATYTGSASYGTGGDALPGNLGLRNIRGVFQIGQNTASAGILSEWNTTTAKLQLFWTGALVSTALAEVTAATNVSTMVWTVLVISIDD